MKTVDEWFAYWLQDREPNDDFKKFLERIQSDAFHAGELKGLEDAKLIIKSHGEPKPEPM